MPEERETIESRSSASQEVYQQTKFMAWFEKAFPWLLVSGAALGLLLMIFLPVIFFQEKTAEQLLAQSNLRLALLYTTGGVIAALGLLETYRRILMTALKQTQTLKPPLKTKSTRRKFSKNKSGNSMKMLSKNVKQNAENDTPKRWNSWAMRRPLSAWAAYTHLLGS